MQCGLCKLSVLHGAVLPCVPTLSQLKVHEVFIGLDALIVIYSHCVFLEQIPYVSLLRPFRSPHTPKLILWGLTTTKQLQTS